MRNRHIRRPLTQKKLRKVHPFLSYDRFCNYSEKYQYFQNFQNLGFSGKTGYRIRNFFGLKPKLAQDGANKKNFSQIGPAVPEEIGRKQTNIVLLYIEDIYIYVYTYNFIITYQLTLSFSRSRNMITFCSYWNRFPVWILFFQAQLRMVRRYIWSMVRMLI